MNNNDHQSLAELGDKLESAIRLELDSRDQPLGRGLTPPRISFIAAVVIMLGLGVAAVVLRPAVDNRFATVETAAGPAVLISNTRTSHATGAETLTAARFQRDVFERLPPAAERPATCSDVGPLQYECTIADATTNSENPRHLKVLFVDHDRLLGGACTAHEKRPSTWDCAVAEAAVANGLLSYEQLDALQSGR